MIGLSIASLRETKTNRDQRPKANPAPDQMSGESIIVSNPENEEQNKNISKQEEAISKWAQTLATQLERFLRTREGQLDFPHHLYERKSGE
jgi:hypothetical protein